jgi:uncharacterized protein YdhG (YjbR/CyaY superfamily)
MKPKAATVSAYLALFPKPVTARLRTLRSLIKKAAPTAEEKMSYGLVGYKLNGKPLVYFGGFKNHVGFYATPAGNAAFQKELAGFTHAKGSVQFPHDKPLPLTLIQKMVIYRVKQNKVKK